MLQPLFYIAEHFLDSTTIGTQLGKVIGILYKVNDRAIRGTLLQKAPFMAEFFDKSTLNEAVFEPMCGGFSDSSSALRELTLKATAALVPHLTHPNLEKLSRYLVRLQSDPESSIRTNTVIFFSKLAPYLTEVTRHKILLPAFVRAMKDPFTPCRLAALRSTIKAKTFFDPMGIASRVMPAITPQLLDPSAEVRREAFTAVDDLLFVLRQESERLATLPEPVLMNPNMSPSAVNGTTTATTTASHPTNHARPAPNNNNNNGPITTMPTTSSATPPVTTASSSGGFSLGGISSWMSSSKSSSAAAAAAPPRAAPVVATAGTTTTSSHPPLSQFQPSPLPQQPSYAVPSQALNQMNMNHQTNLNDDWDDDDDDDGNNDDAGWGDDDDDLDVSTPSVTRKDTPANMGSRPTSSIGATAPTFTGSSASLFAVPASTSDDDDFFGGFDAKPAKPTLPAVARPSMGMGKLVVPIKKVRGGGGGGLSTTKAASGGKLITPKPAVQKLSTTTNNNNKDVSDGWDDF
jgi:SCY1-like protein 1